MMPVMMVYMSIVHVLSMQRWSWVQRACRSMAGTQSAPQEEKEGGGRKERRKQGASSSSSDKDIRELRIQKVFPQVQVAVRSHRLICHHHQGVIQGQA